MKITVNIPEEKKRTYSLKEIFQNGDGLYAINSRSHTYVLVRFSSLTYITTNESTGNHLEPLSTNKWLHETFTKIEGATITITV